jgi:hypothetical protein
MTAQPTIGPATGTRRLTAAARPATRSTRPGAPGRALLAALGLALAAAILPATAVHASPQAPDVNDSGSLRRGMGRATRPPSSCRGRGLWTDRTRRPALRLITCGGSFDRSTGHYRDNVVVYARTTT